MMLSCLIRSATLCCVALAGSSVVTADSEFVIPSTETASRVNDNSVGIVFTHEELYHQLVHNLEDELEHDSGLRIVPIMGKNHVQSVYDLLYLKGVDLALVRADALEFVRRMGDMRTVLRVTSSVATLSEEKILVLADRNYASLDELAGQRVGIGLPGSGEYVTGTLVFDSLGIEVVPVELDSTLAVEQMKSGELAAMVYLLRPSDAVQTGDDLTASKAIAALEPSDGLHVLPLSRNDALNTVYRSTSLRAEELPGLIDQGESLPSYSVDVILAAYRFPSGHPRLARQKRFITALIDGLDGLQSDAYEPAWTRVDLSREAPNVIDSSILLDALAERQRQREQARAAEQRAEAEARAQRLAELARQSDELISRLGQEIADAEADELEPLLERLDALLGAAGEKDAGTSAE